MAETLYALVDDEGVVTNVIVADKEFIDSLGDQIEDPDVDTGDLAFAKAYDVTDKGVGIGHKRAANGKWVAPTPPEPTEDELAAQAAAQADAEQRAADDEFLDGLAAKLNTGGSLTQDERDRKDVILARRG